MLLSILLGQKIWREKIKGVILHSLSGINGYAWGQRAGGWLKSVKILNKICAWMFFALTLPSCSGTTLKASEHWKYWHQDTMSSTRAIFGGPQWKPRPSALSISSLDSATDSCQGTGASSDWPWKAKQSKWLALLIFEKKKRDKQQRRVWSWLRMNASDRLNTCKSRGSGEQACLLCRRPAHGWVTRMQPALRRGITRRNPD